MQGKYRGLLITMLLQHIYMIWALVSGYVRIVNGKGWDIQINQRIIFLQILLILQIIGINIQQQETGLMRQYVNKPLMLDACHQLNLLHILKLEVLVLF